MPVETGVVLAVAVGIGLVWVYINVYTFAPVYRKVLFRLVGASRDPRVYAEGTALADEDLPTIDVLLPAYDERETIGYSIDALRAADYPADRLRINVLVEAADLATRGELARLRRDDFRELVIPPSYPGDRNKPRALNYGFERTDGEIVGVIDAEDVVAPDLFRQVVRALVDGGHDYVQGKLDMQNEGDGVLNTLFRGEYGFWYGTVIPSYFRVGYPVPLGGTTNFMTRTVLEDAAAARVERFGSPWTPAERETLADAGYLGIAPWDPRNVTEDFELGLLLWEMGRSMAMVAAVTREESPVGVNAWVRQRTRWQKGKLFTLAQRLGHPPTGFRRKVHVYTQSAVPHIGPLNVLAFLVLVLYARLVGFRATPAVAALLLVGLALAVQLMVIHSLGYWTVTEERGARRLLRTTLNFAAVPLYWALQWGSDIRAFVQLAFGHLSWEKTEHTGRHIDEDAAIVAPPLAAAGLRMVVTAADDGWRWAVTNGDDELARAGRPAPSAAAARSAAETFGDALLAALGTGAVFEIGRTDGAWAWRLVADGRGTTAVSPSLSSVPDALDGGGRTKLAAALVSTERRHEGAADGLDPTPVLAGTAE